MDAPLYFLTNQIDGCITYQNDDALISVQAVLGTTDEITSESEVLGKLLAALLDAASREQIVFNAGTLERIDAFSQPRFGVPVYINTGYFVTRLHTLKTRVAVDIQTVNVGE